MIILIPSILAGLLLVVVIFLAIYKVVDPNEAHIVVRMGSGRKVYAPKLAGREDVSGKTSYFFIPRLMTRQILPLTNVKMSIANIQLKDQEVAPFICDVISWIRIDDPIMASERLNVDHPRGVFGSLSEDLESIVHATSREAAMKQEILEILRDRKTFSESVSSVVDETLSEWGAKLINLEVIDIKDDEAKNSRVIADYESIRKVKINTDARKKNSVMDREAIEVEQENHRAAEVATAEAEEALRKRQIEKDKQIGISEQEQVMDVAKQEELANAQKVSALRTLEVGKASVQKEATVEVANGEAQAYLVKGEKEADVIKLRGQASADVVRANGEAEAIAKDKMAEAMKKFNDAATNVEKIRAYIEVKKAEWAAYGMVAKNAEIKVVNSGKGASILGIPMNAETGGDLGQMMEGLDLGDIKNIISKVTNTDKVNDKQKSLNV